MRDGADFYITAIAHTNDGISGTSLSDDELRVMRDTNECRINFVITTANGWRTMLTYPVKITHLDQSYVTFDLSNEIDSFSYRTQTKRYVGLPIETQINAYVNGEQVDELVSVTVDGDLLDAPITVDSGNEPSITNLACGIKITITDDGTLELSHNSQSGDEEDLADNKHCFDISAVVRYAGANYESGVKRFVVQEATDTTLYKLLLSANAVSKDEGTYTPSTIDVSVQIWDESGTKVGIPDSTTGQVEVNNTAVGDIYVKYLNGAYDPSDSVATLTSAWSAVMPSFSNVGTCITVLVVDLSDDEAPVILDIESVPMTAKGRDGAGQPWVDSNLDEIVVDCDEDGYPLAQSNIPFQLKFSLFWGDEKCTISTSDSYAYLGSTEITGKQLNVSGNELSYPSFSIPYNAVLSSTRITVHLEGYDSRGDVSGWHTAQKTISVIANRKGAKGDDGDSGAVVRFRGLYSSNTDNEEGYIWDGTFRDAVKYGSSYYLVDVESDGSEPLGTPEDNEKWKDIGGNPFIATGLLLAEDATIENLVATKLVTGVEPNPHIKMEGGIAEFYGTLPFANIKLGVDSDGCAILNYYDKNGTFLYNLGPDGIVFMQSTDSEFEGTLLLDITEYASTKTTRGLGILLNVGDSTCDIYYRFIEGYVRGSGNQMIYRISGTTTPSSYNNKLFDSNELSSNAATAYPVGDEINGWFVAPNYGRHPIWTVGSTDYYFITALYYSDGALLGSVEILFKNEKDWWRDTSGNAASSGSLLDFLNSQLNLTP